MWSLCAGQVGRPGMIISSVLKQSQYEFLSVGSISALLAATPAPGLLACWCWA
jgi:hypothetical protein